MGLLKLIPSRLTAKLHNIYPINYFYRSILRPYRHTTHLLPFTFNESSFESGFRFAIPLAERKALILRLLPPSHEKKWLTENIRSFFPFVYRIYLPIKYTVSFAHQKMDMLNKEMIEPCFLIIYLIDTTYNQRKIVEKMMMRILRKVQLRKLHLAYHIQLMLYILLYRTRKRSSERCQCSWWHSATKSSINHKWR